MISGIESLINVELEVAKPGDERTSGILSMKVTAETGKKIKPVILVDSMVRWT